MSDKPETLSAILAEMRDFAKPFRVDVDLCSNVACPATIGTWADRIEAAYKRERAEWRGETNAAKEARNRIACKMRYEFAAKCRACKSEPGNAAAMREALERIRPLVRAAGVTPYVPERKELVDGALGIIDAALSAPARNADRFATAVEAMEEWGKYPQSRYKGCRLCPHGDASIVSPAHLTLAEWLFAPAKGGGRE